MLCGHTLARLADGPEWCSNPHSECPQGLRVCIRCMCAVVNPSCTVPIRPLCRRPILAVHFQAHEACVWATQAHDACVWVTQAHEAVSGLHKRTRLCLGYTSARGCVWATQAHEAVSGLHKRTRPESGLHKLSILSCESHKLDGMLIMLKCTCLHTFKA